MLSLRQLSWAWIPALCVAACASSPTTDFYTLTAVSPVATTAPVGFAVVVGPTELPRALQRSQIITRSSPDRIEVNETERWAGSLPFDLNRVVAGNLERSLPVKRVVAYPAIPRVGIDYRVLLEIRQFDGQLGDAVALRGSWTIVSGNEELLAVDSFDISQPIEGDSFEALVAAHSAALGQLSEAIKADLLATDSAAQSAGN